MTAPANLHSPSSDAQFADLLDHGVRSTVVALNFYASWASECEHLNSVFGELATLHPSIDFVMVDADALPDTVDQFDVAAVPVFVIVKDGSPIETVHGANPVALTVAIEKHAAAAKPKLAKQDNGLTMEAQPSTAIMEIRLKQLINMAPIVLFMKGTPTVPRCGFSRQIIEILNSHNVRYSTYNILADEPVRQALKVYSNWPTYPQLYINGELVGGLDIVKELEASGELATMLPQEDPEEDLDTRLQKLVSRAPLMVFIKGTPSAPRCGFSRQLITILSDLNCTFDYFDILTDDAVRQGLKSFANWPTFPQVYLSGELCGGLDIVKEMVEAGEFQDMCRDAGVIPSTS